MQHRSRSYLIIPPTNCTDKSLLSQTKNPERFRHMKLHTHHTKNHFSSQQRPKKKLHRHDSTIASINLNTQNTTYIAPAKRLHGATPAHVHQAAARESIIQRSAKKTRRWRQFKGCEKAQRRRPSGKLNTSMILGGQFICKCPLCARRFVLFLSPARASLFAPATPRIFKLALLFLALAGALPTHPRSFCASAASLGHISRPISPAIERLGRKREKEKRASRGSRARGLSINISFSPPRGNVITSRIFMEASLRRAH